jgi:DNA ligase-associated metallophosphoesterase
MLPTGINSDALISLAGEQVIPDLSGAAWLPDFKALIIADIHLEKGSSYLLRGVPLPPFDSRETLTRINAVVARLNPQRIIALGDSFHDPSADQRMDPNERAQLGRLVGDHDWIWIIGNHDPAPPDSLGGTICHEFALGGLTLTHEPSACVPGQVAGHLHPVAKITAQGRSLRRRCFVSDGQQLVLPAFGAYTGGLNVLDRAFAPLFAPRFHAWMIGVDAIYKVATDRLIGDRSSPR